MKYSGFIVVFKLYIFGSVASEFDPIVHIHEGFIRGTTLSSIRSNLTFFAFMGIPYARPPIGELRFKAPQPADSWSGVRNATVEGPSCPQINPISQTYFGEEDCLFINVFSPKILSETDTASTAVMVWIHGGGYILGSGDRTVYGPDFLVDEQVVVVTFNYRLGVLGFLSLQNKEVPGNNGMKDQVLALKWVRNNIVKFGGDPDNITIFGESAGASSVHYHLLSPMSSRLFHRAISESGSALNPWAYQTPDASVKLAFLLGEEFGVKTTDPLQVLQVLRAAEPERLVVFIFTALLLPEVGALTGPTLDTKAVSGEVFLPDTPINLINAGKFLKIPYIIGVNNEEGILATPIIKPFSWLLRHVVNVFELALPFYAGQKIPKAHDMAVEVKNKYFNNSRPLVLQYIDVITDFFFINGVYCTAQRQATHSSPVFSYEFSFDGTANVFKKLAGGTGFPGACHADDIPYLFRVEILKVNLKPGTPEYLTSVRMTKLWANFAKTGYPTPQPDPVLQNVSWKPISKSNFPSLSIDTDLKMKHGLNNGHAEWWMKLYSKYIPDASPCWPFYSMFDVNQ
ncbi:Esterase FE4 [Zootermopsis nevadensis]|nr:Esterase FE4 [Zootermopsis nevadensis]